jgi:hypothetical protein
MGFIARVTVRDSQIRFQFTKVRLRLIFLPVLPFRQVPLYRFVFMFPFFPLGCHRPSNTPDRRHCLFPTCTLSSERCPAYLDRIEDATTSHHALRIQLGSSARCGGGVWNAAWPSARRCRQPRGGALIQPGEGVGIPWLQKRPPVGTASVPFFCTRPDNAQRSSG